MIFGTDRFGEFRVEPSQIGSPTALHVTSGCLIHSRRDPVQEAINIATDLAIEPDTDIVLLGGGMGYLAEALLNELSEEQMIWILEPDAALFQLCCHTRLKSVYTASARIKIISKATIGQLHRAQDRIPKDAQFVVSPYILRIEQDRTERLSGYVQIMRAEMASKRVYNDLIAANCDRNLPMISKLPSIGEIELLPEKSIIVCGAGPSLNQVHECLRRYRSELTIIAASGAVPSLYAAEIVPDWVIALEAKEVILSDIESLPNGSNVIAFSATNSKLLSNKYRFRLYVSRDTGEDTLDARGGSSLIPALDLAIRRSQCEIAIVGADLGWQSGKYARGSNREKDMTNDMTPIAPKFASMRAGLERIISGDNAYGRSIYHVISNGRPLAGAIRISPVEFEKRLLSVHNRETHHV